MENVPVTNVPQQPAIPVGKLAREIKELVLFFAFLLIPVGTFVYGVWLLRGEKRASFVDQPIDAGPVLKKLKAAKKLKIEYLLAGDVGKLGPVRKEVTVYNDGAVRNALEALDVEAAWLNPRGVRNPKRFLVVTFCMDKYRDKGDDIEMEMSWFPYLLNQDDGFGVRLGSDRFYKTICEYIAAVEQNQQPYAIHGIWQDVVVGGLKTARKLTIARKSRGATEKVEVDDTEEIRRLVDGLEGNLAEAEKWPQEDLVLYFEMENGASELRFAGPKRWEGRWRVQLGYGPGTFIPIAFAFKTDKFHEEVHALLEKYRKNKSR